MVQIAKIYLLSFSATKANRAKARDAKLKGLTPSPEGEDEWQPAAEGKVFYLG
jgi:hypothetical protein